MSSWCGELQRQLQTVLLTQCSSAMLLFLSCHQEMESVPSFLQSREILWIALNRRTQKWCLGTSKARLYKALIGPVCPLRILRINLCCLQALHFNMICYLVKESGYSVMHDPYVRCPYKQTYMGQCIRKESLFPYEKPLFSHQQTCLFVPRLISVNIF